MTNPGTLYQQIILRHSRESPHERRIAPPRVEGSGNNPRCGDVVQVAIRVEGGVISEAGFTGEGCALSRASASLLCEAIQGQSVAAALRLAAELRVLLSRSEPSTQGWESLGRLAALSAAADFPARHRCVTLAWSALEEAIRALPSGLDVDRQ